MRAWRGIARFRGQSSYFTWLYRIAVNEANRALEKRARRPAGVSIGARELELPAAPEEEPVPAGREQRTAPGTGPGPGRPAAAAAHRHRAARRRGALHAGGRGDRRCRPGRLQEPAAPGAAAGPRRHRRRGPGQLRRISRAEPIRSPARDPFGVLAPFCRTASTFGRPAMQRTVKALIAAGTMVAAVLGTAVAADAAIVTSQASLVNGKLTIVGSGAVPNSNVSVDDSPTTGRADSQGNFTISASGFSEPSCVATLYDGSVSVEVTLSGCTPTISAAARRSRPAHLGRAAIGHLGHRTGGPFVAGPGGQPRGELPVAGEHHPRLHHPGADRDHGAEGHLDHAQRPGARHLLLAGPVGELPAGAVLPAVRELDSGEFADDHRGGRGRAGDPCPAVPGAREQVPPGRDVPVDLDGGPGRGQLPAADVVTARRSPRAPCSWTCPSPPPRPMHRCLASRPRCSSAFSGWRPTARSACPRPPSR